MISRFRLANRKSITIADWDSLWQSHPVSLSGIAALTKTVGTAPACLVDAATALQHTQINASAYTLQFTPGTGGESQRVLASAVATLLPSGALAAPTLLDVRLPAGAASAVLSINSSQPALQLVRWQVVSRGCEDTQQATGDVATLVL